MSDEEKLNKAVEQAVEVAANKAAEDEIDQLTKFENAIDETLASGYLDDTLTVTDEAALAKCCRSWIPDRSRTWWNGLEAVAGAPTCSCTPPTAW